MKAGTLPTKTIKETVEAGLAELLEDAETNRKHGRFVQADRLQQFAEYTTEYIRLLENTVRACRQTIRVMEEALDYLRK